MRQRTGYRLLSPFFILELITSPLWRENGPTVSPRVLIGDIHLPEILSLTNGYGNLTNAYRWKASPTPNPAPRGGELFLVSFFAGRRPRKMTRMGFPPPSAAGSLIKCRFLKGIRPQKTTQISFPIPLPGGRMVGVFDQGESDHYPINHLINNYDRVMVTKAAGLGF